MADEISWEEYKRRVHNPKLREEAIKVDAPYVQLKYHMDDPPSHCIAWIVLHTENALSHESEIKNIRKGERMRLAEAKAQSHEVAEQEGIPLVVVKHRARQYREEEGGQRQH